MELEHSFTVPAGIDQAWATLLDVEKVAPCMPGATLESVNGDEFTGKVKVKVGPITITYGGQAAFRDRDDAAHTVVIDASGKESRGSGTAKATVHAQMQAEGESSTKVVVRTDLNVTGRPAQFGRGVMNDVSAKLIGQFADCLAAKMAAPAEPEAPAEAPAAAGTDGAGTGAPAAPAAPRPVAAPRPTPEAIDLFETAGAPVLKRLAPVIGGLFVLLVLWRLVRRKG
ncbi:MAG TPA: SRPBCC family protein [Actinomycetes bacterium]|nr:SRPBCC family protein [Actinomycetes bacterium]